MFVLPNAVTIHNVHEIQERFLKYIGQQSINKEITIDASEVADLDASGLQFLLSVLKTFKNEGNSLKIINAKEVLINLLKISGGLGLLGKEVVDIAE